MLGLSSGHHRADKAVQETRKTWFRRLTALLGEKPWSDTLREELEEVLLGADVGVKATFLLLERLEERVRRERRKSAQEVKEALQEELLALLQKAQPKGQLWGKEEPWPVPAVVLVVGVNGTGKTTSIGKLAYMYRRQGKQVLLAAADTFRAAAIDQLRWWAQKVGADVVAHRPGADAGAVVYDALTAALARGVDLVLVDTAGRLHTKFNLMEELRKVHRIISQRIPNAPHEVLLVLDATMGQNALPQARLFQEAVNLTGIVLAKLDGSAKGGIVFSIAHELGLPVLFMGAGEGPEDLLPFDPRAFVEELLRQ